MTSKVALTFALAFAALSLTVGAGTAQEVVSVTVAASRPLTVSEGCPPQPARVSVSPQFALTRTGDVTDGLSVSLTWGGGTAAQTTVSPTVADFAPGSATTTVTAVLASVPEQVATLTLTVAPGLEHQPGDPATASALVSVIAPSCAAQIVSTSPPTLIGVAPSFTG